MKGGVEWSQTREILTQDLYNACMENAIMYVFSALGEGGYHLKGSWVTIKESSGLLFEKV